MPDLSSLYASQEVQDQMRRQEAALGKKLRAVLRAEGFLPLDAMTQTALGDLAGAAVVARMERRLLAGCARAVA